MTPQELAELDLAVAQAEGLIDPAIRTPSTGWNQEPTCFIGAPDERRPYAPSRLADKAVDLLEKHCLTLAPYWIERKRLWMASRPRDEATSIGGSGPTAAIAICRAVIALAAVPQ